MPFHCTIGSRSRRLPVTRELTTSTGVKQRQQKQRQQQFPHAGLRGDAEMAVPAMEDARLPTNNTRIRGEFGPQGNVVEDGEERQHQQLGHQQEQRIGDEFGEENRKGSLTARRAS